MTARNTDWMDDARCVGHPNPDIFFPTSTGRLSRIEAQEAGLICRECPVVPECRDHKRRTGAGSGVWGGAATKEKTSASAGGPSGNPLHGTNARYNKHLADGDKPCQACWSAHSCKGSPNGRSKVRRWA